MADAAQSHLRPRVSQPAAAGRRLRRRLRSRTRAHAKSYATIECAPRGRSRRAAAGGETRGRAAPGGHRQAESEEAETPLQITGTRSRRPGRAPRPRTTWARAGSPSASPAWSSAVWTDCCGGPPGYLPDSARGAKVLGMTAAIGEQPWSEGGDAAGVACGCLGAISPGRAPTHGTALRAS